MEDGAERRARAEYIRRLAGVPGLCPVLHGVWRWHMACWRMRLRRRAASLPGGAGSGGVRVYLYIQLYLHTYVCVCARACGWGDGGGGPHRLGVSGLAFPGLAYPGAARLGFACPRLVCQCTRVVGLGLACPGCKMGCPRSQSFMEREARAFRDARTRKTAHTQARRSGTRATPGALLKKPFRRACMQNFRATAHGRGFTVTALNPLFRFVRLCRGDHARANGSAAVARALLQVRLVRVYTLL